MEYFTARQLVISWLVGFVVAGFALSVNQKRTSEQSCWGSSPWQNEIAIWNLGAIVMLLGVVWRHPGVEPDLLPGLFVLSLAFSINHIVALRRHRDRRYPTNLAAAVFNGIGVVAILAHFALQK
jgi:hypothetical protein